LTFDIAHWKGRTHDLGRMGMGDLTRVYFTYPAVIVYLVLGMVGIAVVAATADAVLPPVVAAALAVFVYPLVWYVLHRFVLHGRFLYKSRLTASAWKRIHFDHHQDPHDLRVLFGALYTTLPTIALVTLPIGYAVGGVAGAAAAFASGVLTTCGYEFAHCVQHLNHVPRSAFLTRIKRLHMAHHFHNETGNFGITNFLWDRLFGTLYEKPKDVPRSATVFNLGYTPEESARYPWVAQMSAPVTTIGAHRERGRRVRETGEAPARQGQG
jgi:sterol desaturase/sphingolipid hydroxylase (fatty acid hydroxylase superfamily)